MNWIDYAIIALLVLAAGRGFMRGFIIEVCGLLGLVFGIWGAVHFNGQVAERLGLGSDNEALSFLITLVVIIVAVALIGQLLTKVVDIAQLSLANKVAGTLFGVVRKTFVLSVMLNILFAVHQRPWAPSLDVQQGSVLFGPIRVIAPTFVPALGETKWVKRALEDLEREVGNTGME